MKATLKVTRTQVLYGAAGGLAVLMAIAAFVSPAGAWPLCATAIGFLAIANLDKFQEAPASTTGVKAVMRQAEAKVLEMREAVETLSEVQLGLMQRLGRWDAHQAQDDALERIVALMAKAGVSAERIREIRAQVWDPYVLYDYVIAATGGGHVPLNSDKDIHARWRALRSLDSPPTPEALESLMNDAGDDDPDRRKILEAYRYYTAHREHQDPALWARLGEIAIAGGQKRFGRKD